MSVKAMKCRNCKFAHCKFLGTAKITITEVECTKFKSKLSGSQYKNLGTCLFFEER